MKKIAVALTLLSFSVLALAFKEGHEKPEMRALFSWDSREVEVGYEVLFNTMRDARVNTLYQEFSKDLKIDDIDTFLSEAENREVEVSLLAGDAAWALDKDGKAMVSTVDRVLEINKHLENSSGIKSILFDVEPYLLEDWNDESKKDIMNDFVSGMRTAYKKAHRNNIEVIVCIPFYYDNMGLSKELRKLIQTGCDSVAIMNYFKINEAKNIKTEVKLADRYNKRVIHIYELQAPGVHGLEEKNTYHNQGILEVEESFSKIKKEFSRTDISLAFHEYKSLREMLRRM